MRISPPSICLLKAYSDSSGRIESLLMIHSSAIHKGGQHSCGRILLLNCTGQSSLMIQQCLSRIWQSLIVVMPVCKLLLLAQVSPLAIA